MSELKVQCDCGQKFKFDVDSSYRQMPFPVVCPVCGVDATEKANALLRAQTSTPAPVAAMLPVAAPAVPAGAPKLRIGSSAPAAPAAAPAEEPVVAASAPARPFAGRPGAAVPAVDAKPKRKPNFALGFLGGVLGSIVGAILFYLVFKLTGIRLGIMALAVGFLGGLGARVLGGEQDGPELGYITAALVIGGIIGAQYMVARAWWFEIGTQVQGSNYEAKVVEAQKVVAAIPTGSDQEIRVYLAKELTDEDEKVNPAAIDSVDVKAFKEGELPEFQNLASGKISKADYEKQHAAEIAKEKEDKDSDEGTFKAVFVLLLLNKVTLVSSCAAAALAFKMSS